MPGLCIGDQSGCVGFVFDEVAEQLSLETKFRPGAPVQPVPDAGVANGLLCTPDGLWTPSDAGATVYRYENIPPPIAGKDWVTTGPTGAVWPGSTFNFTDIATDDLRTSNLFLHLYAFGVAQLDGGDGSSDGDGVRVLLETTSDGGATWLGPSQWQASNMESSSSPATGLYGWHLTDLFGGFGLLPGGAALDYQARLRIQRTNTSGDATTGYITGRMIVLAFTFPTN